MSRLVGGAVVCALFSLVVMRPHSRRRPRRRCLTSRRLGHKWASRVPDFTLARSERAVADAGVADGTQGSHARLLPVGRLVSVLQDAARRAPDASRGSGQERHRTRGRQLRRGAHPRRLFEAPRHYVPAAVRSGIGHHQAVRDSQHDGTRDESTELRHSISRHLHAESARRGHLALLRAGLPGAQHGRQHHGQTREQRRRARRPPCHPRSSR